MTVTVKENLKELKATLAEEGVELVAISKQKPVAMIREAYEAGHRKFGENRAQELLPKKEELPDDIEWHMVGHLQRNKVKKIAPFIDVIQSLDSLRLAREVNKRANNESRVIDCYLQVHIAQEESKYGFSYEEVESLLEEGELQGFDHIRICGLMGMATFTDDTEQVRQEFKELKQFFDKLKKNYFSNQTHFKQLSMGMTSDWQVAVEEGSTMVRIGRLIFGERN
jgi:pyridoxal phosphate enzyme (YggS family)